MNNKEWWRYGFKLNEIMACMDELCNEFCIGVFCCDWMADAGWSSSFWTNTLICDSGPLAFCSTWNWPPVLPHCAGLINEKPTMNTVTWGPVSFFTLLIPSSASGAHSSSPIESNPPWSQRETKTAYNRPKHTHSFDNVIDLWWTWWTFSDWEWILVKSLMRLVCPYVAVSLPDDPMRTTE